MIPDRKIEWVKLTVGEKIGPEESEFIASPHENPSI